MRIRDTQIVTNMIIGNPSHKGDSLEIIGDGASDTVIQNCTIYGGVRLWGMAKNGNGLREQSFDPDHTAKCQAAAPKRVKIQDCTIIANDRIPVYFGPGVVSCELTNCIIKGKSVSSAVYLDAESYNNFIETNVFNCLTSREVLSIDGSAHNTVVDNIFMNPYKGGVFIYRNCGEGGAARHQKPTLNIVQDNLFSYSRGLFAMPSIWTAYRDPLRCIICNFFHNSKDVPHGSGVDSRSYADNNWIGPNNYQRKPLIFKRVVDWGKNNTINLEE